MTSGLNFGIKRSMPHLMGIICGFIPMLIILGFGMSSVFLAYPFLHQAIKIIGVFYLLYLAWLIANSATTSLEKDVAKPISFVQAALFQWLNPKAWVMGTGAISAYTTLSDTFYWQVLYIAFVFFVVALPSLFLWLLGGMKMKKYLSKPNHQKVFNVTMALLLVGSILPVISALVVEYF